MDKKQLGIFGAQPASWTERKQSGRPKTIKYQDDIDAASEAIRILDVRQETWAARKPSGRPKTIKTEEDIEAASKAFRYLQNTPLEN